MVAAISLGERGTGVDFETGREAADLGWFWCEFESEIGFHGFDPRSAAPPQDERESRVCPWCRGSALERSRCRECVGLGVLEPDVSVKAGTHEAATDAFSDMMGRMGTIRSGNAVWRALRVLDEQRAHRHLVVLHRLYGLVPVPEVVRRALADEKKHWNPGQPASEAAKLVTLTAAAEDAREAVACARGEERASEVRMRCLRATDDAESEFWRMAPRWQSLSTEWEALRKKARAAREHDLPAIENRMRKVAAERAVLQDRLDAAMRAVPVEPLRAELSVYANEDRAAHVEEAVVARLLDSDPTSRSEFVARVRSEAKALRVAAHHAYRAAKASLRT